MPRENRKRGKKHKKPKALDDTPQEQNYEEETNQAGPSWIIDRKGAQGQSGEYEENASPDAPFGYVDPDVKAYFKTVDSKLREWQESGAVPDDSAEQDMDPNEERRIFLVAALTELSGKEKQLATDPDCSNIMERMAYSMDDFVKRVLFDRLAGSYEKLARHRFGSHVVQTLLTVAKATVRREARGNVAPMPDADSNEGALDTLTQLILNLSDELLPVTSSLLMDPFASHVLRALLILLCPALETSDDGKSLLRSKKSAKHRAKQGPMKSVFIGDGEADANVTEVAQEKGKNKAKDVVPYPTEFDAVARRFVKTVREEMSSNEIRAMAANKVACPVLVLLLELEDLQADSNKAGSLMDSVSAGLIAHCLEDKQRKIEPSDFVGTLLRDPASSRLLEKLVALSPQRAFDKLWELYFSGKLARLAVHPVANFAVARAIGRLTEDRMRAVLQELEGSWQKFIKNARLGVIKALVDWSAGFSVLCEEILQVVFKAFGLDENSAKDSLTWCSLHMKILDDYTALKKQGDAEETPSLKTQLEPTVQGSLLLQSLLQLPEPQSHKVADIIASLAPDELLALAHHPASSRVLDVLLDSRTVPSRSRRRLILAFHGHFPALVDDRVGSRVGERLWAVADPYLKEKIARGLVPHEAALVGSRYGKFFVRGLDLYRLKRDPEEWKARMIIGPAKKGQAKPASVILDANKKMSTATVETDAAFVNKDSKRKDHGEKRKRVKKTEDEIDALFASVVGKKQKTASLDGPTPNSETPKNTSLSKDMSDDKELAKVFGAIRSAPKEVKKGERIEIF